MTCTVGDICREKVTCTVGDNAGRGAYSFCDVREDMGLQAGVDEGLQLGGQLGVGGSVGGTPHPCCRGRPGMRQVCQSCNTTIRSSYTYIGALFLQRILV